MNNNELSQYFVELQLEATLSLLKLVALSPANNGLTQVAFNGESPLQARDLAPGFQKHWNLIAEQVSNNKPFDLDTFTELNGAGHEEFRALVLNAPSKPVMDESVELLVVNLQDYGRRIRGYNELTTVAGMFLTGRDVAGVEGRVIDAMTGNAPQTVVMRSHADAMNDLDNEDVLYSENPDAAKGLTGKRLRKLYNGAFSGIRPSTMCLLLGRTGVGKSVFAGNLSADLAMNGSPVVIFDYEMKTTSYLRRIACWLSGIPYDRVITGKLVDGSQEYLRYMQAKSAVRRMPLQVVPASGMTVDQLAIQMVRLWRERGVKLFVIDTVNRVPDATSGDNLHVSLSRVSNKLTDLAHKPDYDFSILGVVQASREVRSRADKRPVDTDIRESGTPEQDADVIWGIYYPKKFYPDDPDVSDTYIEVNTIKNREGRTGIDVMHWNADVPGFYEPATQAQTRGFIAP